MRLKNRYNKYLRLLDRDGIHCCYCKCECTIFCRVDEDQYLTIEHIIPTCFGGNNSISNWAVCCNKCNQIRGISCTIEWKAFVSTLNLRRIERLMRFIKGKTDGKALAMYNHLKEIKQVKDANNVIRNTKPLHIATLLAGFKASDVQT